MMKTIIKNLVGQASTIIDEVVTTEEEKMQLKQKFETALKQHEKEMFELEVSDRKSARSMFAGDGLIQKILAIIFTGAYFFLSYVMFRYFVVNTLELSDYEIEVLLVQYLELCQVR